MQTFLTLVAVVVAALVGWWWWQAQPGPVRESPPVEAEVQLPQVVSVAFPTQISADGESVQGEVSFRSPTGSLSVARFEVVEAAFFTPFEFDPQVYGVQEGAFSFFIGSIIPQQVTLRVVLVDDAGNASAPYEFSFVVVAAEDLFGEGS